MSNINLEAISEDTDLNRLSQHSLSANPTKKRSGFQITSVKDSDHGRPTSIVHDGEESADDLDESHASYSDVSYSRTNDGDNDQESTASEDTLSISVNEITNSDPLNHTNPIHNAHLALHQMQTVASGLGHENATKQGKRNDVKHEDSVKLQQSAVAIPKSILKKQLSEQLDPPKELLLDKVHVDSNKESKSDSTEKKVHLPQSSGNSVKVTAPSVLSDQSIYVKATVPSSTILSTAVSQPPRMSPDTADTFPFTEKTNVSSTAAVTTQNNKPVTASSTVPGSKAPGTRVYKVVKREATQPTKKTRGRWNCHEYSDTQSPVAGIASANTSVERRISYNSLPLAYPNSLLPGGIPYQSTSFFQDQLLSGSMSTTRGDKSVMSLGADALKSAINRYTSADTSGDAATGDTSVANRTQKIDNKIEAAMDLVKKHLMSAVRDEVDELKEKIKDLNETISNLSDETSRLKVENKELRSKLPTDVVSQVQAKVNHTPPKDISTSTSQENNGEPKFSGSNTSSTESPPTVTSSTQDQLSQKGMSTSTAQDESSAHIPSVRSTDHKVKIANSNSITNQAIQATQRQDVQKTAISKTVSATGQPPVSTPIHMQKSTTHNPQQVVEPHMQEHGHMPNQDNLKMNQRTVDHNFERNNPS